MSNKLCMNIFFNPEYGTKIADVNKFVLKGSGTVQADYNRIELHNVKAEDNEIVLSYHWMKQLKAVPDVTIKKTVISGDLIGFIRIKNPPPVLILINSY